MPFQQPLLMNVVPSCGKQHSATRKIPEPGSIPLSASLNFLMNLSKTRQIHLYFTMLLTSWREKAIGCQERHWVHFRFDFPAIDLQKMRAGMWMQVFPE